MSLMCYPYSVLCCHLNITDSLDFSALHNKRDLYIQTHMYIYRVHERLRVHKRLQLLTTNHAKYERSYKPTSTCKGVNRE